MRAGTRSGVLGSVLFSLLLLAPDPRTGEAAEGTPAAVEPARPAALPRVIHVSRQRPAAASRPKRNLFYQSGLRLCGPETAEQVASNHLSYFHLRVCQETVWEAFKIFWDRLPEQDEYQSWMSRCRDGTVAAQDIGSYFSRSEEHRARVEHKLSETTLESTPAPTTPEPAGSAALDTDEGPEEDAVSTAMEENPLLNDITVQPTSAVVLEQVLEMSMLLTGEVFSTDLHDPASLHFQMLSRHLVHKIEDALEDLPGFRSVSVIDFRPQRDGGGTDGVVADYAVTVLVDGDGVSSEQLDYLTLQSNRVENSYREVKERSTVVTSKTRDDATEDVPTAEMEDGTERPAVDETAVGPVDHPPQVQSPAEPAGVSVLPQPSETTTASTSESDVVVLEESEVVTPAVVLVSSTPEDLQEEGLLLEETVQTHAVETPEEPPATELLASSTLPEPPVEVEASGSGPAGADHLPEPSTTAADEENVPGGEPSSENEVIIQDIGPSADVTAGDRLVDAAAAEKELPAATLEDECLDEVVANEIPEDLESSTAGTQTTEEEEEGGPAQEPEEDGAVGVVPTHPEEKVREEGSEETAERDGGEEKEETSPEAGVAAPEISTEDLTEDEILLATGGAPEPSVTTSPGSPQPTALSPGEESPFTQISIISPDPEDQPDISITSVGEVQTAPEGVDDATTEDQGYAVVSYGFGLTNQTEEGSTGFPFGVFHGTDQASIAMPVNPGRALIVFFSLRVTNMVFSEDLFNKSSPEYKALEQRFLELLVPYLQSNLSHFENLEILNFRNGSIVVNSRMKFGRPVARGVTTTVYLILEDFCNTAYQTMNLAIDKYSLDVESGDQADPCKFQACNEYAECKVNKWSGEAECVCNAGYFSVDGLPCQSICELQTDFCLNDGKCDIIPGQGAICRCRVGENWWYRGEHCEEYVSEPLVVGIAIASVAGFLLVASGVLFFLARTLRDQYDKDESEDPIRRAESLPSLERATKYNPMYESEATTGYSHYYRRYPEAPVYSSASAEASTDFSSEEIRHIYENSELTKEEIQDRIRIIELYAKDRQFADFVRQHQAVLDTRRGSSSTQT